MTEVEDVIVDASIMVDLIANPSVEIDGVVERLRSTELHAPDHLPVEVANVVRRLEVSGRLSSAEAALAAETFWAFPITLWRFEPLRERVAVLGGNLSSYDAAYVALAERLDAPLVTRDRRLAGAPGIRARVEVL